MADLSFLLFTATAGIASFFNPCGMVVLLSYITNYFAQDRKKESVARNLFEGAVAGFFATLGFLTVFGVAGFVITFIAREFVSQIPWLIVFMGLALVVVGVFTFFGRKLPLAIPVRVTQMHDSWGFYKYGVIYALASFGCTAPVFLLVVVGALTSHGLVEGVMVFLAYSLGMGAAMIVVTMGIAVAKEGALRYFKQVLPYVDKVNGLMLVFVGLYLIWYQWSVGFLSF